MLGRGGDAADLHGLVAAIRPDDLLTIIYTSGTTGPPKGVELTHANVLAQLAATSAGLGLSERMRVTSYLPMAHIAERLVTHYLPIGHGWRVTTCAELPEIRMLLREVRPEVFFSPPRLWEKMRAATLAKLGEDADGPTALAALGLDAVRVAITGAAPCPAEVIEFWGGLGLPLSEVYGMSETTGVATVNPPEAVRPGTVGTALPGVEVALSETGEILMRGPVIMRGYRNRPGATAEAIDADGWMHSGDIGVIDDDGYLKIVDRIKELIISARRQEHVPGEHRGDDQGRWIADRQRLRDRRRAALQRRAHHAGLGRRRRAQRRGPRSRRRGCRADRQCQRTPRARGADQALHDPARRLGRRQRRADADVEAQAARDRRQICNGHRSDVLRMTAIKQAGVKAFVVECYGKDGLRAAVVPQPKVGDRDVLVKVSAASVNPLDKMVRNGEFKQLLRYKKPFVLGHDVAGVVTQIGRAVRGFKVGDEIYARPRDLRIGTFAEYIAIDQDDVAL